MSPNSPIPSLTALYSTPGPDESVRLHQGQLGIRQGDYAAEGDGKLDLGWTSRPKLRFDIPSLIPVGKFQAADCILAIPHPSRPALPRRRCLSRRRATEERVRRPRTPRAKAVFTPDHVSPPVPSMAPEPFAGHPPDHRACRS